MLESSSMAEERKRGVGMGVMQGRRVHCIALMPVELHRYYGFFFLKEGGKEQGARESTAKQMNPG